MGGRLLALEHGSFSLPELWEEKSARSSRKRYRNSASEMTEPRRRRRLSDAQKAEIVARQNNRCAICGRELVGAVHMDHRIALGLGGADHPDNIQALCARPCHSAKTKIDAADIARAKRRKLFMETGRHKKAQSKPIRSRGFQKAAPQNTATRPIQKWAAWREGA